MIEKGATSVEEEKSKNEIHLLGPCWERQTTSLIAFIFGMLARKLSVHNAGLKVDASQEILTVVMTSYYENVHSCKRHTVVCRVFCFWQLLCSFLASRLTTVSLDS